MTHWQPSASFEAIKSRARLLQHIRSFFAQRNVLEVETPVLSCSTITDPFIESFNTTYLPLTKKTARYQYYLHTSPEFPMKRLLAAGLGCIYQVARVFRQGELGNSHNPEFTLLEWYRVGFDHHQLMQETNTLLTELITPCLDLSVTQYISYQQAFEQRFHLNPHTAGKSELVLCCQQAGLQNVLDEEDDKDRFLDLLFSHSIQPELGREQGKRGTKACITFIYDYPASQASLARIKRTGEFEIAERFEVFIKGIELGNGFHELNDGREQRQRFEQDNRARVLANQACIPLDERLLISLSQLPDCSGVAIGVDRLLMILLDTTHIRKVISFPFDIA